MKTKSKQLSNVLILGLAIVIIAMLCCMMFITGEAHIALAVDSADLEQLCKTYTDSDTIYGMDKSIFDYPSSLYASKVTIPRNYIKVDGDDPIINIVPKEYFLARGEYCYIGKEYGFFIITEAQIESEKNNVSTVFVFDIATNNNLDKNNSRVSVRISPIFQYDFAYVTYNETNIRANGLRFLCDGVSKEGNIVPIPNNDYELEQSSKFYLKDVSFGLALYNEQELNPLNANYQPEQDDGSFIIMYDYAYNGVQRTKDGVDLSSLGIASLITSSLSSIIGVASVCFAAIPPASFALGALSTALGTAGTIMSGVDVYDQQHTTPYFVNATSGKITSTCYYTTRRDQLAHYVDEKTKKPTLVKAAAMLINGDDDRGNLWYNVGSYAEGYFTLSDSAQTTPWYTRYIQEIALTVVDKDGNEHIKNGYGSNTYMLHEPIYKEAKFDDSQQISFLPEGNNYFAFNPQYTSDYTINFDKKYNYVINAQDVTAKTNFTINPVNGVYKYKFIGGHQYKLRVYSPLGDVLNLNIAPADSQTAQSIAGNSTYLYKYACPKNQFVTVSTSQTNAPIANIYTKKEGGGLNRLPEFATFKQSAAVEMYLQGKHTYYFLLRNTGTSALSTKVNVNNLDRQLSESKNDFLQLYENDNYKYYQLVPSKNGNYHITFDNSTTVDYIISYYCFDEKKDRLTTSEYREGYLVLKNLEANKKYYIGIMTTHNMRVTPKVSITEPNFEWRYFSNSSWKVITNNDLYLSRGQTYKFAAYINGIKAKNYDVMIGKEDTLNFSNQSNEIENCRVKIENNALDHTHINIQAKFEGKDGLNYDNTLFVYAEFDPNQFKVASIEYTNNVSININKPEDVIKWNASLLDLNFTNLEATTYTVYNSLIAGKGQVAFKITNIVVRSAASGGERTIVLNLIVNINVTYASTEIINGKTVYHINNALQLYNIRYNQEHPRILDNDISLAQFSPWTPIPTLTCDLNGNGKKITNLTMDFTAGQFASTTYFGFVGVNHATISNLTFENVNASLEWEDNPGVWKYAGVIAGANVGTIQHCYVTGNICGYRDLTSIGGIAGANNGNILNTEYGVLNGKRSKVYSWGDVGGIAGQSIGKIQDCRTLNTDVEQRLYGTNRCAGGIIGYGVQGNSIIRCTVENSRIANVNEVTIKSLYPKMGIIVGHDDRGIITSVGMSNVTTSTGGLYKNNTGKCFNGGWPFFGWLENCTVDGNTGQTAP